MNDVFLFLLLKKDMSLSSNVFFQPSPELVLKILDILLHTHAAAHFPFPPSSRTEEVL